jgi:putative ABC transport system substrate-binding protein
MRRRDFIFAFGATVAWPFAALAQQAGRTYRLGSLEPSPREAEAVSFFDELRRRGFIEGQNLTIDYRNFAPHVDLISEYAAELVKAKPDVIYAGGGVAVRAVPKRFRSSGSQTIWSGRDW